MADAKDKYAGLPGLDSGPDLFNTPELTDDTSTAAPASSFTAEDDALLNENIDRQHLDQQTARLRFLGSRVDAREADFSDRINTERRSYQVKSRRRRRRDTIVDDDETRAERDGGDEDDWSEEEDPSPEVLKRRLARLKRDAAELRSLVEKKREEGEQLNVDGLEGLDDDLQVLNKAIAAGEKTAEERLRQKLNSKSAVPQSSEDDNREIPTEGRTGYTISYAPTYSSSHALAKAASFDTRLALLETLLGADSTTLPTKEGSLYRKPLLPTLDILDKQLSTLTSASAASLDGVHKRVQALYDQTEKLAEARQRAKEAQESLTSPRSSRIEDRGSTNGNGELGVDDPEQVAKINALHGTLPTIEALAPILPGLLDRLRSLRLLHTDAANASKSLSELERRQAEMDTELAEWKESLDKVEKMLGQSETNTQNNMKVVEGWVGDIAERMKSFGK